MIIATLEIKRHAHCYTWSEALCSMPYMMGSFMLNAIPGVKFMLIGIHGLKLYAQCYS